MLFAPEFPARPTRRRPLRRAVVGTALLGTGLFVDVPDPTYWVGAGIPHEFDETNATLTVSTR